MTQLRWVSGSCSHVGNVRERNEDSVLERSEVGLWAVADGMGGLYRGDYASSFTTSALPETLPPETLDARIQQIADAVTNANAQLIDFAKDGEPCGTTLTVLTVVNGLMACLWIGDSRAYLWREATLEQITQDHTEFQALADACEYDEISNIPADCRHVLTRAIGVGPELEIDLTKISLVDGDVIVICSDGLYDELDDMTIAHVIASTESPQQAARLLVERALEGDCNDNVSVVVVHFERWN